MLLFILITLSFIRASTAKCTEHQRLKLLDCTGMSLKTTEGLVYGTKPWVYVIDLRRNLVVWINDTLLLSVFPNLQLVDLRENSNIDCRLILESWIQSWIGVKKDCKTKSFLSTQQSRLRIASSSLVPSAFLSTQQSLLWITSSPLILLTLGQNQTLHSPHAAKNFEQLLIISVTVALIIGFLVLLLCFYGCHRFHRNVWLRHRKVSLHVQLPSQIEFLSVTPLENNEDIRSQAVTEL